MWRRIGASLLVVLVSGCAIIEPEQIRKNKRDAKESIAREQDEQQRIAKSAKKPTTQTALNYISVYK
jgi:hypothetical protein